MKKNIILSILFFAAGFLIHALFFPDVLSNGFTDIQSIVIPNASPTTTAGDSQNFMTNVTFDGEHFSKHGVTMERGSYITITNSNKNHVVMSLASNNPLLATPRGYGESEAIRVRLDNPGQFVVEDKLNPQERLLVRVK